MRLLTHNMLHSAHKHGVQNGYPLKLVAEKIEEVQQDINKDFLMHRLPQLNLDAFGIGCNGVNIKLIDIIGDWKKNKINWDEIFKQESKMNELHHALLEIRVIDGYLECPESGRKFPIADGIPNMLLMEDEVENVKYKSQQESKTDNNENKENEKEKDKEKEKEKTNNNQNQTQNSEKNTNTNSNDTAMKSASNSGS